jgi:hypothetical protein
MKLIDGFGKFRTQGIGVKTLNINTCVYEYGKISVNACHHFFSKL